ncbi:MAG TPA: hypothetical protein VGE76_22975, partial [Opitutaceae bacterium]
MASRMMCSSSFRLLAALPLACFVAACQHATVPAPQAATTPAPATAAAPSSSPVPVGAPASTSGSGYAAVPPPS